MAEPETLAELGEEGQHALEVFLRWCREERTGPLTFHFRNGVPRDAEATDKVALGQDNTDRKLQVVE